MHMNFHGALMLIGNLLYIMINILFFVPISYVMGLLIKKYRIRRRGRKKTNVILFAVNILFCGVTATAVFGLLFMACLQFKAIENHSDIHENQLWRSYHGIFVLFYGKQNALMLLVLYMRVYYIFKGSRMKFRKITFWFFNIAFLISIVVFIAVPVIHSQRKELSIWTVCASTFCVYNVAFMSALSYLFSSKLLASFRNIQGSGNRKGRTSVVNMMTKTSLLAMLSIAMTLTSCILLILRYSIHYESTIVYTASNWLMSLDIYSNFFFVSLTMAYFDKYYQAIFGKVDSALKSMLYGMLTKGNADAIRFAEYFEHHGNEKAADSKKSSKQESGASKDRAPSNARKSATSGGDVCSEVNSSASGCKEAGNIQ